MLLWPLRSVFYKKIGILTYISPLSSIRNHSHIQIGEWAQVNSFVTMWPTRLVIGRRSQINPGTAIYGHVVLGQNVMIAPNCMLAGGNHRFSELSIPMIDQGSMSKGIIIEDDVWIGANSVILDGISIGTGAVIAAGSVVTKNVESFDIVAGIPARKIGCRRALGK